MDGGGLRIGEAYGLKVSSLTERDGRTWLTVDSQGGKSSHGRDKSGRLRRQSRIDEGVEFYSAIRTRDSADATPFRSLVHGGIMHGGQLLGDEFADARIGLQVFS